MIVIVGVEAESRVTIDHWDVRRHGEEMIRWLLFDSYGSQDKLHAQSVHKSCSQTCQSEILGRRTTCQ